MLRLRVIAGTAAVIAATVATAPVHAQQLRTSHAPARAPLTSPVREGLSTTIGIQDLQQPQAGAAAREEELVQEVLDAELTLSIHPRHSKIVRTRVAIERVSIADPAIVQLNEFDPFEVEFIGGQTGQTTLTLWLRDNNGERRTLRYLVRCLPDLSRQRDKELEYGRLQDRINELFPNSQVQLFPIEDKLIVRGQAHDALEARNILRLLGQQVGSNTQNQATSGGGDPRAGDLEQVTLDDLDIVNLLQVPGEHQVMLKVRIAELSRNAARELGVNFNAVGSDVSFASSLTSGNNLSAILDSGDLELFLRAFSTHGYGKVLAEPTLVTISGKPATFLAGGEFAVPTAVGIDGIGAATTTFRGFGTQLTFTPTVIDKDLIRMQVSPSFSTLNTDATVNGIPGLNSRSVNTTVDLREGQWLAIAGLIQDEQGGQRSEVPVLGRIPGLRQLFGSQTISRDETELVVLVSPQLVHPLEPEQAPMILPGMDVTDPTDKSFFLGTQIEGDEGFHHRSTTWPEYRVKAKNALLSAHKQKLLHPRRAEYCDTESYYISGPSGFSK